MEISKYQLASKLHLSHQAIYKWCSGKSNPSTKNLRRLARELGLTVDKTLELLDKGCV